jgi:hypothetical protein
MKKLIETSKILDAKRMPDYKFLIINYLNFIEDLNCSLMVLQCTILNSCCLVRSNLLSLSGRVQNNILCQL